MNEKLHQELVKAAHKALAGDQVDWEQVEESDRIDYTPLVDAFWDQLVAVNTLIFVAEQVYKRIGEKDYDLDREGWSKLAKYHGVNFAKMGTAVLERLVSLAEQMVKEDH